MDKAEIFINYRHSSADQDSDISRRVNVVSIEINFVENINYCHKSLLLNYPIEVPMLHFLFG